MEKMSRSRYKSSYNISGFSNSESSRNMSCIEEVGDKEEALEAQEEATEMDAGVEKTKIVRTQFFIQVFILLDRFFWGAGKSAISTIIKTRPPSPHSP